MVVEHRKTKHWNRLKKKRTTSEDGTTLLFYPLLCTYLTWGWSPVGQIPMRGLRITSWPCWLHVGWCSHLLAVKSCAVANTRAAPPSCERGGSRMDHCPYVRGTAWETDRIGTRVPSALAGVYPYRCMPATSSLCQGGSGGEVLTHLRRWHRWGMPFWIVTVDPWAAQNNLMLCHLAAAGCLARWPSQIVYFFYVSLSLSLFPLVNLFSFLKGLSL